jgi:hypothetical protein
MESEQDESEARARQRKPVLLRGAFLVAALLVLISCLFLFTDYFPKTECEYFDPTAGRIKIESRVMGIPYYLEICDGEITPYYRQLISDDLPKPVWLPCTNFDAEDIPRMGRGEDFRISFIMLKKLLDRESLTYEMRGRILSETLRAAKFDDYRDIQNRVGKYISAVSSVVGHCSWYDIPLEIDLIPMLEDTGRLRLGRAHEWVKGWFVKIWYE